VAQPPQPVGRLLQRRPDQRDLAAGRVGHLPALLRRGVQPELREQRVVPADPPHAGHGRGRATSTSPTRTRAGSRPRASTPRSTGRSTSRRPASGLPGTFITNIQATYLLEFSTTTDEGIVPLVDYAGTLGVARSAPTPARTATRSSRPSPTRWRARRSRCSGSTSRRRTRRSA
jgi:hypothetical protein